MKETKGIAGCFVAGVAIAVSVMLAVFVIAAVASVGWHVGGMWWA